MIGLGSYAFFWAHKDGLSLDGALRLTHDLGIELFQVCDFEPIDSMSDSELSSARGLADDLGISLELGTRGLGTEQLLRYLDIAALLGAPLLRSMVTTGVDEAAALLDAVVPHLGDVTLALETYEFIPTAQLVELVTRADDPRVGICLDPANTVSILEHPNDVVDLARPFVRNIHVKDFAFTRRDGWVGFTLAGCPLGEGLLDVDHLLGAASPQTNRIIEHWAPWQGDLAATVALETEWTTRNIEYLRSH